MQVRELGGASSPTSVAYAEAIWRTVCPLAGGISVRKEISLIVRLGRSTVKPHVTSAGRPIRLRYTTDRMRLNEKPVTVAMNTIISRPKPWPLARPCTLRSTIALPQPANCRFQNARFLFAKKGAGREGSTAIMAPL